MVSALSKLPDGTVELTLTLPWSQIKSQYEKALSGLTSKTTVKGFRKGKAPQKIVEKNVDKTKLYEEVLREIIPDAYKKALIEHKLKPVINPKVQVITLKEGSDWQIKATTCEQMEITLGNYREEVKKVNKTKPKDGSAAVLQAILKTAKLSVPKFLIDDEVTAMLSRLIDQANKLGITVDQYLASMGKTSEQLRTEYQKQAEEMIKLEWILGKISTDQKTKVEETEIDKMIDSVPEEKTRQALRTPGQRLYIKNIIAKRKTIDSLLTL